MSAKFTLQQAIEHQKRHGFGPIMGATTAAKIAQLTPAPTKPVVHSGSPLEEQFLSLWTELEGPALEREVCLIPGRMYRNDFIHRPSKSVIECEGYGLGHFKKEAFYKDAEKYAILDIELDWRVYRITRNLMTPDWIAKLKIAICRRTP